MPSRVTLLGILALLLGTALACGGGSDAAGTPPPADVTQSGAGSAPTFTKPPPATATSAGTSVSMGTGTYCWSLPGTPGLCIDMAGPVTGTQELAVTRGARVTVATQFPATSITEATVSAFPVSGQPRPGPAGELVWNFPPIGGLALISTVDAAGVHFDAALATGRYVVIVFLRVPQGDVSYGVVLDAR